MNDEERLALVSQWNAAIQKHQSEINGLPLTRTDIEGRFMLYAAALIQAYKCDAEALTCLLEIAARTKVSYTKLQSAMGNA